MSSLIVLYNMTALHFVLQRAKAQDWSPARERTALAMIEALIQAGALVNAKDLEGKTPLHWAVSMGTSPALVQRLAKAGANPRLCNKAGKSCIDLVKDETILAALVATEEDTQKDNPQ